MQGQDYPTDPVERRKVKQREYQQQYRERQRNDPAGRARRLEYERRFREKIKLDPERHEKRKAYSRVRNRAARLGITPDEVSDLLARANGLCEACGNQIKDNRDEHIDHCHATGKIRGVLCGGCNVALGRVQDSPERLRALIGYLERTA